MTRMSMKHLVSAFRGGGSFLLMATLAACSSSKPLTNTGPDAASVGSAGASGSSGASGGDSGRGGSSNTGGSSAGGVTGSAGSSSGGASAGSTGLAGSSGGTTGSSSSKVPDAGAGSGGSTGGGGSGGKSSDVPGRDAAVSSDGSPDTSPDSGRIDGRSAASQQYVTSYVTPFCSRLATCCAQNGFPTPKPGACEADQLGFAKSLDDGSSVINPSGIQTILTMLQDSCDQPSFALLASTTKGTRAAGAPCEDASQCEGESTICLNGKCVVPPRGKAGDACAVTCDDYSICKWTTSQGRSPYSQCHEPDGLRCDYGSFTCVPLKAAGDKCADSTECGAHSDCSYGTCVARTKLGADCSRIPCDRGLQCGNGTGSAYICQKASIAWSGSCSP
jgi:hypothetical protein